MATPFSSTMLPNPLTINFSLAPSQAIQPGVVTLPKIYQGAPYQAAFAIQNASDKSYRDFSGYDEIRMQVRLAQGKPVLFELTQTNNTIGAATMQIGGVEVFAFQFDFPAELTDGLSLPVVNAAQINEVRFVHDIELIAAGKVVERLAQGTGYIVVNTTRQA